MVNRLRGEAIVPDDLAGYTESQVHAPPVRRMSVDEYHRLIDIGFFHPEERLELVEGVLWETSPISPRHRDVVHRLLHLFQALGDRAVVFMQSPVVFDTLKTEPEPDLVVVKAPERLYRNRHPSMRSRHWLSLTL